MIFVFIAVFRTRVSDAGEIFAQLGKHLAEVKIGDTITDNNKRSVLHSRIIMVVFMVFVAVAVRCAHT